MRYSMILGLTLSAAVLVAACGEGPDPSEPFVTPDTTDTRGTQLTNDLGLHWTTALIWVPGTDNVVADSNCAVLMVDVTTGTTNVIDDECIGQSTLLSGYYTNRVVASDGSTLYYTIGNCDDPQSPEWVLRETDLAGDSVTTLRSGVSPALALSRDGQRLAYLSPSEPPGDHDSLIVRDLSSGIETYVGDGLPILFSPDGAELLYAYRSAAPDLLRRQSLSDGTSEEVPLGSISLRFDPDYARTFRWDSAGVQILFRRLNGEYHVRNLLTSETIQVPECELAAGSMDSHAWAWSQDGNRVAYWTSSYLWEWSSLSVADIQIGTCIRVVHAKASAGPSVFSPDGTRIVYTLDGDLYSSAVP